DDTVAKLSKVEDFKTLSLLQVLDLEGTWFSASHETGKTTLPDVVKNLVLLRYLGLNDTYIDDLPPSIKTLRALQTLYLDREILV
ncbi:hypothetical protein, partial [Klebsiella pneumoniae]|uniref:leucine-rich repeat domain-containing protein n=1 Tax=Klebsiella pneumoniae TaxID=573 RepID=UPI0039C0D936